jgi:hypothetical protein
VASDNGAYADVVEAISICRRELAYRPTPAARVRI